jgi:hypothetical protein
VLGSREPRGQPWRLVQRQDVDANRDLVQRALTLEQTRVVEEHAHATASSLGRVTRPRVTDQHATHDVRSEREERRTVLPLHAGLIDQPKVGFVDERRRSQRMAGPLVSQPPARHAFQLDIDGRHEGASSCVVASVREGVP